MEKALALIKQCKKCIADAESRLAKVKSDDEADNEAEKQEREGDTARDQPSKQETTKISDVEKALALIKQCKKCIADAESRLAKVKSDDEADNEAEKQEREGRHHP